MLRLPDRVPLALLPTPLERADALSRAWGGPTIWIKRDDLTGFGVSGNKIRKLEFHFAAAKERGADTVITCGAVQSNHCRATALAAARLGLRCRLVLRSQDGGPPQEIEGNHLLQRLAGAGVRFVDVAGYEERDAVMADEARRIEREGATAWVIPEGASDLTGMWGFVVAMQELAEQLVLLPRPPAAVWHAASSGGTTAGIGWATDRLRVEVPMVASSVGEKAPEIRTRVEEIWAAATDATGGESPRPVLSIEDRFIGEGYGIATHAELETQRQATSLTGQLWDPTYTGKTLHGLRTEIAAGRYGTEDHVIFWHTGGGFAVFAHDFTGVLD